MTSKIDGWVDGRHRPLINIRFVEGRRSHTQPALIDTGFNGYLLMQAGAVHSKIPHRNLGSGFDVEVVGGLLRVSQSIATIAWLGEEIQTELLFSAIPITQKKDTVPLLVGTKLLGGSELNIDFLAEILRITKAN